MAGPLDRFNAPYGPTAPAQDFQVFANPSENQPILGRSMLVLADGNVVVVTAKGETRTITAATAGTQITCAITSVQAATTATVLVYTD